MIKTEAIEQAAKKKKKKSNCCLPDRTTLAFSPLLREELGLVSIGTYEVTRSDNRNHQSA